MTHSRTLPASHAGRPDTQRPSPANRRMAQAKTALFSLCLMGSMGLAWAQTSTPATAPATASAKATALRAPTTEAAFMAQVQQLYSFEPRALSGAERAAKSAQLDAFWQRAKANSKAQLPWLRKAVANDAVSAFFHYDGAKLLLSLSSDQADQQLALQSIAQSDLRSLQHTDYLRTVQSLGAKGLDTRAAAFNILGTPDFKAFIPQHALTLGQDYALIVMLFPMPEAQFVGDLVQRLAHTTEPTAQKSLALALWYTQLPEARASLKQLSTSPQTEAALRSHVNGLLARKVPTSVQVKDSEAQLRAARRARMSQAISDEALLDFDQLTGQLLRLQSP